MDIKFYLVGGAVRDELLGLESKDRDYAVVAPSYEAMKEAVLARGGKIFLETPKYFTLRAMIPGLGAVDCVLSRREGFYSDGRHPDSVEVGTIYEELSRRDFSVNAIAKDEDGNYYDPFFGRLDIENKRLDCVGYANDRFREDSLRLLRAIRFSITKGFTLSMSIQICLRTPYYVDLLKNVSRERIREELLRCFSFNTLQTLNILNEYPLVRDFVFTNTTLWLKPTNEGK